MATIVGGTHGLGMLALQRRACADYANRQPGWRLVDAYYDDPACSEASLDRPGLQRLLTDAAAGKLGVVVVASIDRVARDGEQAGYLTDRLAACGVSVVSTAQLGEPRALCESAPEKRELVP